MVRNTEGRSDGDRGIPTVGQLLKRSLRRTEGGLACPATEPSPQGRGSDLKRRAADAGDRLFRKIAWTALRVDSGADLEVNRMEKRRRIPEE